MQLPEEVVRAFASGTPIITANARAARWLNREYAMRQQVAGRQAWPTPPILDWKTWLRQQWQANSLAVDDAPLLLTSLQERSVWVRMQHDDAEMVVSPENMAALAESAYALLSAYEAHRERHHEWGKTDAERFRQWSANFDRECARRNWIPHAALEQKLSATQRQGSLPNEILLVGFDRITPAQNRLLGAMSDCGVGIRFAASGNSAPQLEFIRASGLRDEITACAHWARKLLEQDPEMRIGVLAPDLGAVRAEVERVFRRILMPESDNIFSDSPMPFEFSLGQPLAHVPVVRAALLLLRWLHAPLREEEVSWLLLSGFVTSNTAERLALAKLDANARDSGTLSLEVPLQGLLRRTGRLNLAAAANLHAALRAAAANRISEDSRRPGRWTDLAQTLLREAGWPGGTTRGTLHYQAMRRWERALDELALLDFDGQQMRFADFLSLLELHTRETIFAPESLGAPIHIMGALESSGQTFDAMWFLGADDANWPSRGRTHPLLPNDLQRRHRMPYADAGNDFDLAKAITNRIAASAPLIVFSHAARNKDGELRPSPLLPRTAEWRTATPQTDPHTQPMLETIEEPEAQIPWPRELSPGGSEVLKDQAACPFRAFARKRLRAQPLNRRDWGLSAAERGKLLHKVLETIWSPARGTLHSLADLRSAMADGRMAEILRAAIQRVFADETMSEDHDPWMRAYLQNEQQRLHVRLTAWMEEEARRVPFDVIACEEKLHDVDVGGLKLKLRADRIDQLAGSERLLIDYKTGEVAPKDWEPPRPNEPQLPLYAVFGNVENVCGALFARIRAGQTGFAGTVADAKAQLFDTVDANSALVKNPYKEAVRDEWQEALLALAGDFLRGNAVVDPKYGAKSCEHCPLPGLCRIAEIDSLSATTDNGTENGSDMENDDDE